MLAIVVSTTTKSQSAHAVTIFFPGVTIYVLRQSLRYTMVLQFREIHRGGTGCV